jgi:hypothetical protein
LVVLSPETVVGKDMSDDAFNDDLGRLPVVSSPSITGDTQATQLKTSKQTRTRIIDRTLMFAFCPLLFNIFFIYRIARRRMTCGLRIIRHYEA